MTRVGSHAPVVAVELVWLAEDEHPQVEDDDDDEEEDARVAPLILLWPWVPQPPLLAVCCRGVTIRDCCSWY
jgi:hypothetical protein